MDRLKSIVAEECPDSTENSNSTNPSKNVAQGAIIMDRLKSIVAEECPDSSENSNSTNPSKNVAQESAPQQTSNDDSTTSPTSKESVSVEERNSSNSSLLRTFESLSGTSFETPPQSVSGQSSEGEKVTFGLYSTPPARRPSALTFGAQSSQPASSSPYHGHLLQTMQQQNFDLGNDSPLLLSPVLARPRSLSSYHGGGIPSSLSSSSAVGGALRKPSDSEAELLGFFRQSTESPPLSLGEFCGGSPSRTGLSPSPEPERFAVVGSGGLFPKSKSANRLGGMTSSGIYAPSEPILKFLARTRSDLSDKGRNRRRKSTCGSSMVIGQLPGQMSPQLTPGHYNHPANLTWSMSVGSSAGWETPTGSLSNLSKCRGSSLGQSAPNLTAPSLIGSSSSSTNLSFSTPAIKLRKELGLQRRHSNRLSRRSYHAVTAPCHRPGQNLNPDNSGVAPRIASPLTVSSGAAGTSSGPVRPVSQMAVRSGSQSGSTLHAPSNPDTRRWSVASLPSSSGYGTPGSSAFSSQYSSQERLACAMEELNLSKHYGSSESNHALDDYTILNQSSVTGDLQRPVSPISRVRSRSLSSLAWLNLSSFHLENSPVKLGDNNSEMSLRNAVYKERFPKAKQQMEERLERFIADNGLVSGGTSSYHLSSSSVGAQSLLGSSSEDCSSLENSLDVSDPELIRILADGAARFLHHQIMELTGDCLGKSREDLLSSMYFCDMSQNLEELLVQAREKAPSSFCYLSQLVRELLIIVSRAARLLECLEFDPDEFYQLLEEAEGHVRDQLPVDAQINDLPQYIIGKLGLDRDNLIYSEDATRTSTPLGFDGNESFNSSSDAGQDSELLTEHKPPGALRGGEKSADIGRQIFSGESAPSEEDFESVKLISNGAYGAVYLVRHKLTRQRFALKMLNKANLVLRNQVEQVFAERDILTFTDNPFVVSFYGSFETKKHLCMVLEYVEGGDCASLLKSVGVLPVDLSQLYIAETVLAVEYLHSYGIVHRDLKPDNLLITAMGHVKLTDFGLSKIGLMNRTTLLCEGFLDVSETIQFQDKQLCGTPEYIAPEVILRQGYGKPVDWWAVGIIMYEFLCGIVPFFGDTPEELFAHVISDEYEWPEEPYAPPDEAKNMITLLLQQNPLERLGTLQGAIELKVHPFFDGVDWNSLLRQKAEFIPQLESEEDTSYFDTRADRHNHDVESGDEDVWSEESGGANSPMFWSFSSASPRHSICTSESGRNRTPEPPVLPTNDARKSSAQSLASQTSIGGQSEESVESGVVCHLGQEDGADRSRASSDVQVVFRQRRVMSQCTVSSSSSGTGTPSLTAESSIDMSSTPRMEESLDVPITVEGEMSQSAQTKSDHVTRESSDGSIHRRRRTATVPLPRFAISIDIGDGKETVKELSPVEERQTTPQGRSITHLTGHTGGHATQTPLMIGCGSDPVSAAPAIMYRHRTSSLRKKTGGPPLPPSHLVSKSPSLHVVIPSSPPPPKGTSPPILVSPGGSSTSSRDGSPSRMTGSGSGTDLSPLITQLKPPVVIRKGPRGFGFTMKSVRVYLGEDSEYYTIQHIVMAVEPNSPAQEAGLKPEDLITHVHGEPVQNLTHPQMMQKLLSYGNQLSIRVTPMENTSIRTGAGRKTAGKLARKKGYKQKLQRRAWEKKRKVSLLRRLSGKRTSAEISSLAVVHKPGPLPRSVSSQEGMLPGAIQGPAQLPMTAQSPYVHHAHHRLSDTGIQGLSSPSSAGASASSSSASSGPQSPAVPAWQSRPSSLHGLKHKIAQTFAKSPNRRKQAQTMPLSPLARADNLPPPGAVGAQGPQGLPPSSQSGAVSPARSPSPLATGVVSGPSPGKLGSVKKTITKPRKSDPGGSELLRLALSPQNLGETSVTRQAQDKS